MGAAIKNGKAEYAFDAHKIDGEKIRVRGVFIYDPSDKDNPKIISFSRDITKEYNADKEIKARNRELKKYIDSNLQLENFAYFASHDLRTPLRSIISFTQLLQKSIKDKLSPEEKEYMQFIVNAGNNMQALVNDLLSYSRINSQEIKIETIDVAKTLGQIVQEMSCVIEEKKAEIFIQNIPVHIEGDRTKLKQLFQNLISNALKFVDRGKKPVVRVNGMESGEHWQFSVEDNGIGIAPNYKEKIFMLFKRLHNATEYEGTGIGLALCKKIAEQHHGKIWFESEEGKGTCFHFTLHKNLDRRHTGEN